MGIYQHKTEWAGKPIVTWRPGEPLQNPSETAYALRLTWEDQDKAKITMVDRLTAFVEMPGVEQVTGLVIGHWGMVGERPGAAEIVQTLVAAQPKLPNLTALFMGEIVAEESEISWIEQDNMAPLFNAYPQLTHFGVRGGSNLTMGANQHQALKMLVIETGGLNREVLHDIWKSDYPALDHLELWLGTEYYGANTTIEDLQPLLNGTLFPALKYLGLRNSDITDEIAQAVVKSPLLPRLEVLDLSLGTLGDAGAKALLASDAILGLRLLDLHHHYCTEEVILALEALPIAVNVDEAENFDDEDDEEMDRYVAVSE